MYKGLTDTQLDFQKSFKRYGGKVRDVYEFEAGFVALVASDRISAFDHILPRAIPYKGEVLTAIAQHFLKETNDIVPNWLLEVPHPAVAFGKRAEPIKIEMVIRGYLTGHAWREYRDGKRQLCGVDMPDGMKENEAFPKPIITPATKAEEGHDEDISKEDIIARGIIEKEDYEKLERYTRELFKRGTEMADRMGLILVDTKYEFGYVDGEIILIDEVHTPDSSRYFYQEDYAQRLERNEPQRHLSKEFVREWLISEGFQGLEGQKMPAMSDDKVKEIQARYFELYEQLMGSSFIPSEYESPQESIQKAITDCLRRYA